MPQTAEPHAPGWAKTPLISVTVSFTDVSIHQEFRCKIFCSRISRIETEFTQRIRAHIPFLNVFVHLILWCKVIEGLFDTGVDNVFLLPRAFCCDLLSLALTLLSHRIFNNCNPHLVCC